MFEDGLNLRLQSSLAIVFNTSCPITNTKTQYEIVATIIRNRGRLDIGGECSACRQTIYKEIGTHDEDIMENM